MRSKAQQRARTSHLFEEPDPEPIEVPAADLGTSPFVALHRELLTGIDFDKRGEPVEAPPTAAADNPNAAGDDSIEPDESDGDGSPREDAS
jgi:hypothetical protein